YAGLKVGEKIFIPGEKISKALNKLWDTGIFSDINIYLSGVEGDSAVLELEIIEVPQLSEVRIQGVKKKEREELIKENELNAGAKVTENLVTTTRNYITNKYKEEGYLNSKVVVNTIPVEDTVNSNLVNMVVNIDKGEKVKVDEIIFEGNTQLSDARLKRAMKNTKEE